TKGVKEEKIAVQETTATEATATYDVSFTGTSTAGGTIMVEGIQIDAASYRKQVEENNAFQFVVLAMDGWKVRSVKADDQDVPKAGNGNDNEYVLANVTKNTQIDVVYEELPKETESDSNDAEVRKNVVTFQVQEGASVTVEGADATNATAMAKEGEIVFTVTPADGFTVTEVLVDGVTPARTTGNLNEYVIGGILTDETIVNVSTQTVETESAADEADEPATEEETTEEETTEEET
ncbi:hypothetical protein VPJ68_19230, partial [Parabacteroides distasonis]